MRALTILAAAWLALAASVSTASAQGLYVGGQLGFSWGTFQYADTISDLELDSGLVLSGVIGKDTGNIRYEGELAYRQNDINNVGGIAVTGEMTSTALMGNLYYDFGDGTGSEFYLGAGMGAVTVTMQSVPLFNVDDSDTTFAFQLMLGGSFPVSEASSITVELRGFGAIPEFVDAVGPFEQDYSVGSLMFGYRHSF